MQIQPHGDAKPVIHHAILAMAVNLTIVYLVILVIIFILIHTNAMQHVLRGTFLILLQKNVSLVIHIVLLAQAQLHLIVYLVSLDTFIILIKNNVLQHVQQDIVNLIFNINF